MVKEGDLLWTPSAERIERSHLTAFTRWLARERGLNFIRQIVGRGSNFGIGLRSGHAGLP